MNRDGADAAVRLVVFVGGDSPANRQAVAEAQALCAAGDEVPGRRTAMSLEVVDVRERADAAERHNVVSTPTVICRQGDTERRVVGPTGGAAALRDRLGLPASGAEAAAMALPDLEGMAAVMAARGWTMGAAHRFDAYLDRLAEAVRNTRRRDPLRAYCLGLLHPHRPKTTTSIARIVDPRDLSKRYQSMHHLVAQADWSDEEVLAVACAYAEPAVVDGRERVWTLGEWVVQRSSPRSVGVDRQAFGVRQTTASCQVALVVTLAWPGGSLPIAHRLFLPRVWADSAGRRAQAEVPREVKAQERWALALDLILGLLRAGVQAPARIRLDAVYGSRATLVSALAKRGIEVGIAAPGERPDGLHCLDEMVESVGLSDYHGRGWRGFHHHLTLCTATYAFILAERGRAGADGRSAGG